MELLGQQDEDEAEMEAIIDLNFKTIDYLQQRLKQKYLQA